MIRFLMLMTAFISACSSTTPPIDPQLPDLKCTSAREFITTVNYLREDLKQETASPEINQLATEVAKGCSGAAERFIATRDLLLDAKFNAKIANDTAIKFAQSSDDIARTFTAIFRTSYEKGGLDLTASDALKVAERLSLAYQGNATIVADEYKSLTSYCVSPKELNLPRAKCASITQQLILGAESHKEKFAERFVKLVDFLRDNDEGPGLTTIAAVTIATDLTRISPYSGDNFQSAYKFASAKKGLAFGRADATQIAKRIAAYSRKDPAPTPTTPNVLPPKN